LTLMVDVSASSVDLGAWAEAYNLTFPVMHDNWSLAQKWSIPGTPAQHLVGKGGEILAVNTRVTQIQIEEALAQ
jgi:hypothetical protein